MIKPFRPLQGEYQVSQIQNDTDPYSVFDCIRRNMHKNVGILIQYINYLRQSCSERSRRDHQNGLPADWNDGT